MKFLLIFTTFTPDGEKLVLRNTWKREVVIPTTSLSDDMLKAYAKEYLRYFPANEGVEAFREARRDGWSNTICGMLDKYPIHCIVVKVAR